jgi:hypothetical protein
MDQIKPPKAKMGRAITNLGMVQTQHALFTCPHVFALYLLSQQKRFKKRLGLSIKRTFAKAYKKLPVVPDEVQLRVNTVIETYV